MKRFVKSICLLLVLSLIFAWMPTMALNSNAEEAEPPEETQMVTESQTEEPQEPLPTEEEEVSIQSSENSVASFSLDKHNISGYLEQSGHTILSCTFEPSNAKEPVEIVSSDPSVVTMEYNEDYNHWVFYYHKLGTATLTATTASGLTDTCTVTVKEKENVLLDQPFEVTVQPHDIILYDFTPEGSSLEWYSFYAESGDPYLNIEYRYKSTFGDVDTQTLCGGQTYTLAVWNNTDSPETYRLRVKKSVPVEKIVVEQESYSGYPGDDICIRTTNYPMWSIPEEPQKTVSDETVAFYNPSGSRWVQLAKPGTATITFTASTGVTAQCSVTVKNVDTIQPGQSKTVTLGSQEEMRYSFTPTEDGTYVLYMPEGEHHDAGYSESFSLYVKEDGGGTVSDKVYAADYEAVCFDAKAGHTYYLKVGNWWAAQVEITGTVTLEKYTSPTAMKLESASEFTRVWDYVRLDCVPVGGSIPFIIESVTWTVSDESIVSIDEYWYQDKPYASFQAKSVGTATITATLPNGLSATYEVVVNESKNYKVLNEVRSYVKLQSDNTLVIKTDAPAEKFDYIYYSGDDAYGRIPAEYYTVTESDTGAVITISAEFMETLPACRFFVDLKFVDGSASTAFIKGTRYDVIGEEAVYFIFGSGESVSFQIDAPCGEFKRIDAFSFDGNKYFNGDLSAEYYTLSASGDTTVITLNTEYLKTLKWGYCYLTIRFENGFADCSISVTNARYNILNEVDGTVSLGNDGSVTVETDIPYNLLDWVTIDGEESDLITASASNMGTTVTLSAEYIQTLTPGYHEIRVWFIDERDGEQIHGDMIHTLFLVGTKYEVIDGSYSVAIKGSDDTVTFTIGAPLDKLTGMKLYSTVLSEKDYTAIASGNSTVITLNAEFLATLDSSLANRLYVYFTDGIAKAWFYLMEEPEYKFFDDSEDAVVSGSSDSLKAHIDAPLEKFDSVTVDGEDVPTRYYTLSEGSTIITFSPEYLSTLSIGTHLIVAYFDDGDAYARFEVQKVPDYISGDVNGDGKVNGKDGVLLAQYLAGRDVTIITDAADVNGDGKINGKDGVILAQYLAGWNTTLK